MGPSAPRAGTAAAPRHRPLRFLALASVAATYALIAAGALVRATGSGEGCPGWPRCFGRWVPPLFHHPGVSLENALIEYSHRFVASLAFAFVVGLAAVAWARYRGERRVLVAATLGLALWPFQAILGGLVVRYGLTPALVTLHLATAMAFAGTLAYAAVAAYTLGARPSGPRDGLVRLAWAAAGSVLALIVVGGLVRGEGAGLAFLDWPLMDGRVVPALGSLRPTLMFAHRALAVVVAAVVAALAVRAWRAREGRPPVAALGLVAAGLFVAQVLIGAANVWTRLAAPAVVAHVTVSGLIWGALVAGAAAARASSAPAAERPGLAPVMVLHDRPAASGRSGVAPR